MTFDYGEPTYSEFETKLKCAVQCLYIANAWKREEISEKKARERLLDWDDPDHKHEPGRLEYWAGEND